MKETAYRAPNFHGRFGIARRDITPPLGIYARNWGAALNDTAQSVHRPLTLTVLTLQENTGDTPPLAILSLDLGWWRSSEEEKLLAQAVKDSGILAGGFILALTHTHAGPIFSPLQSNQKGGEYIADYLQQTLCGHIRDAIGEALSSAQLGIFETVSGFCGLAQNRDLQDPAAERFLVGWNPSGVPDQTLLVGRVTNDEGIHLATLINYACHPTILAWENSSLSPDYVGAMRELVETETGAVSLFLQGASGDLAPRHQYVADLEVADRAGRCLGHAVLSLLSQMSVPGSGLAYKGVVESGAPLAVWVEQPSRNPSSAITTRVVTIDFPLKKTLPSSEALHQQIVDCECSVTVERLRRTLLIRQSVGELSTYSVDHLVWLVGDIIFVAIPNEVYSELQVRLREVAADFPVFVVTLANGGRGYLVSQKHYEKDLYAIQQSPFAQGAFEMCQDAICQEISRFTKQSFPSSEKDRAGANSFHE